MIAVAAPSDRAIERCTLGYAWQLAVCVHVEGWHPAMRMLLDHLVGRVTVHHPTGIGMWWS